MLNSLKRSFYLMVVSWHWIIIFFLCVSYFHSVVNHQPPVIHSLSYSFSLLIFGPTNIWSWERKRKRKWAQEGWPWVRWSLIGHPKVTRDQWTRENERLRLSSGIHPSISLFHGHSLEFLLSLRKRKENLLRSVDRTSMIEWKEFQWPVVKGLMIEG